MNKTQKSLIGYSAPRPYHEYAPVLHYDFVDGQGSSSTRR